MYVAENQISELEGNQIVGVGITMEEAQANAGERYHAASRIITQRQHDEEAVEAWLDRPVRRDWKAITAELVAGLDADDFAELAAAVDARRKLATSELELPEPLPMVGDDEADEPEPLTEAGNRELARQASARQTHAWEDAARYFHRKNAARL